MKITNQKHTKQPTSITSSPVVKRLLIFDIDGTLLLNGRIARDNFFAAFRETCRELPDTSSIHFMGMTDRGIFRQLLDASNHHGDFEEMFCSFSHSFTEKMRQTYQHAKEPHLLPGVRELLEFLHEDEETFLALGTGNIRESAYLKLKHFGIDHIFPVGGFGGDYENRNDAILSAATQAMGQSGLHQPPQHFWIIGDTQNDIIAGHSVGAKVLAVASGFVPLEELIEAGGDIVLPDLSDLDRVLEIFGFEKKASVER
ncbi:HAD hydrolase-like protein [bacterium]|nr:HAD hydrolase-like protein [bacterium]